MSSFQKAFELQADLIELDVQLTKDGEVVVFHDFSVERTTDGKGLLRDYTLSELKKLDAGSWFSVEFAGERIPTLEEVLAWAQGKIWLSIELKQIEQFQEPLAEKVVDLVKSYKMEEQVQIMSFNHFALAEVRKYTRKILTSVICSCRLHNPVAYLRSLEAQVLNTSWEYLSQEIVEEMHRSGFYVCGSVSDDISVWELFQRWHVDLMDTNIPDVMIRERRIVC